MATDSEQLTTIKRQTLAIIADLTAQPKPSYTLDGQSVSWDEYLAQLQATVRWCDEQLSRLEPFEMRSQGYT
jgi:hypothetical protein